MSYDYVPLRAEQPVRTLEEFDEENLESAPNWEEVKSAIASVLPDIEWSESDGHLRGISDSVPGRLELLISYYSKPLSSERSYASFSISGSFRTDQTDTVKNIAEATDFTASQSEFA